VDSGTNHQTAAGLSTLELRSDRQGEENRFIPCLFCDTETALSS